MRRAVVVAEVVLRGRGEVHRPSEEARHLTTSDRCDRAVVGARAAVRDLLVVDPLDRCDELGGPQVVEHAHDWVGGRRRCARGSARQHLAGGHVRIADQRAVEARRGGLRVHERRLAGSPHRRERELVAVVVQLGAPQVAQGLVGREERLEVSLGATVAVGDHGTDAGLEKARAVVVDALFGDRLGGLGVLGLGVARGVAQVVQQDDRVRCEIEGGHRRFAVVLEVAVTGAGGGI